MASDGVRLCLHRRRRGAAALPPVLLFAGTFSNRSFWPGGGQGPARVGLGADGGPEPAPLIRQ